MISPDVDTGLSTKGEVKEERIMARRQRLSQRQEEALEAARGAPKMTETDVAALKERNRKSKQQVVVSKQRLHKLKADGTELAGNVRVAFNAREAHRRVDESGALRSRVEKIEAERTAARERFEEISKKWESALSKKLPQDLMDMLTQQKQQCDALFEEKDKLIQEFQQELRLKDDRYVKDLKKQGDDVDMILERMEQTVTSLTENYLEELEQIEAAFESERAALMQDYSKEWADVLEKRRRVELDNLKSQQEQIAEHQRILHEIRISDAEEMCQLKNKLENEIQVLQQQMQATKASYQLNTEKLEYNYHVLKKRDEENSTMRNAQKRKLGLLNDQYMNLKKKLALAEKQTAGATRSLSNDYRRITEQFRDLEKKAKHFSQLDKSRYRDIWKMNEEIARGKVDRLLEVDRLVREQQLGVPFQPPPEVAGPVVLEDGRVVDPTQRSAHDLAKTIITSSVSSQVSHAGGMAAYQGDDRSERISQASGAGQSTSAVSDVSMAASVPKSTPAAAATASPNDGQRKVPDWIIRKALELLVKEADYLIEPRMGSLVESLDPDEQLLMKVDSLFKVLLIESEDDVRHLVSYFVEQAHPPPMAAAAFSNVGMPESQMSPMTSPERTDEPYDVQSAELGRGLRRPSMELPSSAAETVSPSVAGSDQASPEAEDYVICKPETVQMLLHSFVEDRSKELPKSRSFWSSSKLDGKAPALRVGEDYWKKLSERVPETEVQMWRGLVTGLKKYNVVLINRDKQRRTLEATVAENAELEAMLHDYMQSDVNYQLQFPPTYSTTQ